jgi:hypothetical protein
MIILPNGQQNPCQNCRSSDHECVFLNAATADAQFLQRLTETKEAPDAIENSLHGIASHHIQSISTNDRTQRKRSKQHEEYLGDDSDSSAHE